MPFGLYGSKYWANPCNDSAPPPHITSPKALSFSAAILFSNSPVPAATTSTLIWGYLTLNISTPILIVAVGCGEYSVNEPEGTLTELEVVLDPTDELDVSDAGAQAATIRTEDKTRGKISLFIRFTPLALDSAYN